MIIGIDVAAEGSEFTVMQMTVRTDATHEQILAQAERTQKSGEGKRWFLWSVQSSPGQATLKIVRLRLEHVDLARRRP